MKILLITEFFPTGKDLRFSGGVEARTFFVARGLAKKHEIKVLTSLIKGSPLSERMFGFEIIRVAPKRNYDASVGHMFSRMLFIKNAIDAGKSINADIVDGGNYISHFIAKRIATNKKVPIVAWYPDVWLNTWIKNAGIYGLFGEVLERLNLSFGFDAYITISNQTAQKLKKFVKNKIHIIYCGVDKNEFKNKAKKSNNPTIICVSRLSEYKNIKALIFAFAHLSVKVKQARLIIVGRGPQEKCLKNQTKALKISAKVKFLSDLPRKELVDLYKSSHIFSLPSIVEGFGIATIEAAAAGLPYVNSDITVQKEITKNGQGGYLVDSKNPLNFSQKFQLLLNNPDLYKKKSLESKRLSALYNWESIIKKTESVYYSLLDKK